MAPDYFVRHPRNPIITASDIPYECNTVFNPGVAEHDGDTVLLLRIEDRRGQSHLTVARSKNGVDNWKINKQPLIEPKKGIPEYCNEMWGCEDPRITYLPKRRLYAICYTSYSPMGAAVSIALTKNFETVDRIGMVLAPSNKNAALFPRKFDGEWIMLHRPMSGQNENIWITKSLNMKNWGDPRCLMMRGDGPAWDTMRVGAGAQPIETDEGWLLIYHGVKNTPSGQIYRLGFAFLDSDDPSKVIYRHPTWIMSPQEMYERCGDIPNVVYTCGVLRKEDELWMYYGAADTSIALATGKIDNFVKEITSKK